MRLRTTLTLALALALFAPVVVADHVFSHRTYVVGRVVDAQGIPVAGSPVAVQLNVRAGGACIDSKPERTGPQGDFEICRHTHVLPANASAHVTVEGIERDLAIDPDLRLASLRLQLPGAAPAIDLTGVREFNRTYLVAGRHFARLPEPSAVEGVNVNGTPLGGNVTARLIAQGREIATANASPDEHGDFRLTFSIDAIPEGAMVRVESGREVVEETASALFRRSDVLLVRDDRLSQGPREDAPGSAPGKVPLGTWAPLAALALSALAWRSARRR